ncbi:MAG: MCP four helix bundle domain-containing protein [Desulfobacula sp.]|nr:MCP four helix bundle domain-containing protein [Desulfobacula sp.]
MFKNKSLGTKIISGYLVLIIFVAIIGLVGYKGIRIIAKSLHTVGNEEAPVVDMANEMKLSLMVARNAMEEYKAATATIATDDVSSLDDIKKSYTRAIEDFDMFLDAIVKGAALSDGTIVIKTDNEKLASMALRTDDLHNNKFQVSAAKMMELGNNLIQRSEDAEKAMEGMESIYYEVFDDASLLEKMIAKEISERTEAGNVGEKALAILKEEVPLADMANELKIALAQTRIILEEFIQVRDPKRLEQLEKEYKVKIEHFDQNADAILNGATIDGTVIFATDNKDIRTAVEKMDENHTEFRKQADKLMNAHKAICIAGINTDLAMEQLDKYGDQANDMLGKVEELAGFEMESAKNTGAAAVKLSITWIIVTLCIAVISGLLIGIFLTRAITKLVNLGYIFTGGDAADRRRKVLYLTEKGVDICNEVRPVMDAKGREFEEVLTMKELKSYYKIMEKLQKKAKLMLEDI